MKKIITIFREDSNKLFFLLTSIVVIFFLVEIGYYVIFLNTWFDEANFGYKSWLTSQEMAQPFQDFRSKYPPLAFYSQMIWQDMFGPSIFSSRILSALFLVGMVLLIFDICRRMGNRWIGLIGLSLFIFHPYLIGNFTSAVPYSLTMFFALLSVWFFSLKNISGKKKILLASLAMSLAMLVRHNLFPALVILWIFVFFYWRSWKYLAISMASSLFIISIAWIPYIILDFEYAFTWFWLMFGPVAKILPLDYFQLPEQFASGNISKSFFSFLSEARLKGFIYVFIKYFHLWVIFISAIFLFFTLKKENLKNFWQKNNILVFVFILTIFLFVAHFLGPRSQIIYSLYFAPLLIISATGVINLLYQYLKEVNCWSIVKRYFTTFLVIMILSATVSTALVNSDIIFFNQFDYQDSDLNRIKKGADYLQSLTSRDDIILTIDDPQHVFMAGRYVIPPLINKHSTYVDSENIELLNRFKFYNISLFIDWLENTATVVVFQRDTLEERIGIRLGAKDKIADFQNILNDNFELVGSVENVYPRKYTRGNGVMEIYRRK